MTDLYISSDFSKSPPEITLSGSRDDVIAYFESLHKMGLIQGTTCLHHCFDNVDSRCTLLVKINPEQLKHPDIDLSESLSGNGDRREGKRTKNPRMNELIRSWLQEFHHPSKT